MHANTNGLSQAPRLWNINTFRRFDREVLKKICSILSWLLLFIKFIKLPRDRQISVWKGKSVIIVEHISSRKDSGASFEDPFDIYSESDVNPITIKGLTAYRRKAHL